MTTPPLSTDVLDHPAVRAWVRLSPGLGAPVGIERLQKKKKGRAYRLHRAGPDGADIVAKRSSPQRIDHERTIYECILPLVPVPTVRYHGHVKEPDGAYSWLFLEDAGGEPYSPMSDEHRRLAANWLGGLHASPAARMAAARLPDRGPDFYRGHLHSGHDMLLRHLDHPALTAHDVSVLTSIVRHCEVIASHWSEVERFCDRMPRTFIHGDFAPKNMRIRAAATALTLVAFDWGSAGCGVVAPDLVQSGASSSRWSYWASPDLVAYLSTVRDSWPHLDLHDLRRLAIFGQVFRCLVCVSLSAESFATEWVERAAGNMRIYEAEMADAIRAADWTRGGQ
jgi:hypothetical protein